MDFRSRLDVVRLLAELGIEARRRGSKLYARCPSPEHRDADPSWAIIDDPGNRQHGGHHCFSCKFGGGPWELVTAVRGVSKEEACEFVTALVLNKPRRAPGVPTVCVRLPRPRMDYRLPPQVQTPALDGSAWPKPFAAYLRARGVTAEQVCRWRMGYATRGTLAWRVVIPVQTAGRLVAHVARAIFEDGSERYHMPNRAAANASPASALLGEAFLDEAVGVLTLAEGAFSMLALERAGAPNPVALLGSDWSPERAAILARHPWKAVVVATDPDLAGDRVARAIDTSFRKAHVFRLRMDCSPDDAQWDVLHEHVRAALSALGEPSAMRRVLSDGRE